MYYIIKNFYCKLFDTLKIEGNVQHIYKKQFLKSSFPGMWWPAVLAQTQVLVAFCSLKMSVKNLPL